MHQISQKIWAYISSHENPQVVEHSVIRKNITNGQYRLYFPKLVSKVAILSFLISRFFLLFRGQKKDYFTHED